MDIDYGCNDNDPESIIAVILDNGQTAQLIVSELNKLGFNITKKSEIIAPQPTSGELIGAWK